LLFDTITASTAVAVVESVKTEDVRGQVAFRVSALQMRVPNQTAQGGFVGVVTVWIIRFVFRLQSGKFFDLCIGYEVNECNINRLTWHVIRVGSFKDKTVIHIQEVGQSGGDGCRVLHKLEFEADLVHLFVSSQQVAPAVVDIAALGLNRTYLVTIVLGPFVQVFRFSAVLNTDHLVADQQCKQGEKNCQEVRS